MAAPLDPANVNKAISLYLAGKPLSEITAHTGVSESTLNRHRKARGVPTRPTSSLDPQLVVRAYLAGASEYAIAREHGVSRGPIARVLREAGVERRGCSEAGLIRNAQLTSEERKAQVFAANVASRGRRMKETDKVRRALHNELSESHQSAGEQLLGAMLREQGLNPVPQRAIGVCNVDLAINPVAVEVLGGGWHASKAIHALRIPYILDHGWNLVMVWDHEGRSALSSGAAEYLVSFTEEVRRNPPATCQYRVISGDGELLAARGREDDQFPVVPPPRSRLKMGS